MKTYVKAWYRVQYNTRFVGIRATCQKMHTLVRISSCQCRTDEGVRERERERERLILSRRFFTLVWLLHLVAIKSTISKARDVTPTRAMNDKEENLDVERETDRQTDRDRDRDKERLRSVAKVLQVVKLRS